MDDNKQLIKDLKSMLNRVNKKMNRIQSNIEKHEAAVPEKNANLNDAIAWGKKAERMSAQLVRCTNVYLWLGKKINELEEANKK